MSRIPLAAALAALATLVLAAPAPAAGVPAHAAKKPPSCKVKAKAKHKSGYAAKARRCKKAKPLPAPVPSAMPVKAALLDGSSVTVDLGNGVVRTLPLSGAAAGLIYGGYRLSQDNTITMTKVDVAVAPGDLLTDSCEQPTVARSAPSTVARLDPATRSTAQIFRTGDIRAPLTTILRLALEQRASGACGAALAPTGYTDNRLPVTLTGKVVKGEGLPHLRLDSAPTAATINACFVPGPADKPCAGAPTAVPATVTLNLVLNVQIG